MRVRDGLVLSKNNWRPDSGDPGTLGQHEVRLERRRPPEGYRHLITIAQLRAFIELLPDWQQVAVGLDAIVLDSATDCQGWCGPGVVAVCAWQHELWDWWRPDELEEHRHLLDMLDVQRVPVEQSPQFGAFARWFEETAGKPVEPAGLMEVRWTEAQARAYQLLHVLPHELGHHHDRMTTHAKRFAGRGEAYAEGYANRVLEQVWPAYGRRFGV